MNEERAIQDSWQWAPSRWWRATGSDGRIWCETSDYDEVMRIKRPDDVVQRLWERHDAEWRTEERDDS